MHIVYDSMLGKTRRAAENVAARLSIPCYRLKDAPPDGAYVLFTHTIGFGEVPRNTLRHLEAHADRMVGVACSGNRAWGENFARAGITLSEQHGVPLLHRFELEGTPSDLEIITQRLGELTCDI